MPAQFADRTRHHVFAAFHDTNLAEAFSKFFSLCLSQSPIGAASHWLRSQVTRIDLKSKPVGGDDLAQTRYRVNAGYRIGHFPIQAP
jgi:hypothetical protein